MRRWPCQGVQYSEFFPIDAGIVSARFLRHRTYHPAPFVCTYLMRSETALRQSRGVAERLGEDVEADEEVPDLGGVREDDASASAEPKLRLRVWLNPDR